MSANNQLIVCKIKKKYCVFMNGCVDNEFTTPKSITEGWCLYKADNLEQAIEWANNYARNEMVEYGVDVRVYDER